jgi:uncharacterized Zn finger protein
MGWSYWPKYVPVAERKRKAAKQVAKLIKKGKTINPVIIEGRNIANTFWGKAWCKHLESYRDYDNRLPRGRTYVRNGSVLDLNVEKGEIHALVAGSSLYKINITITPIQPKKWHTIVNECSGKIDSLLELLQGKLSRSVMEIIIHESSGLFPKPNEIKFNCSCPDGAYMCKHIAATLYGVGARFDEKPEQFFLLRHVDHGELINAEEIAGKLTRGKTKSHDKTLAKTDLSSLFGIDIDEPSVSSNKAPKSKNEK